MGMQIWPTEGIFAGDEKENFLVVCKGNNLLGCFGWLFWVSGVVGLGMVGMM